MPKKLINDYIFYKIVSLDNSCDLCYVGSTVNWRGRCNKHKSDCTNKNSTNYNTKIYQTIRANGGWDNFIMIEIGTAKQLTLRRAKQIEEDYRVELKASMNDIRCYLSEEQKRELAKEYREANREYIKEWINEYYKNNEEHIKANASEKITCECGCQFRRAELSRHKKTQKHINLMLG